MRVAVLLLLLLVVPALAEGQGFGSRGGGSRPGGPLRPDEGPNEVGGYSLWRTQVHALFDDGADVRTALAAYEAAMADAEARGALATAVRAGASAVLVANRLGMQQKTLTLGPRVIELGRKAPHGPEVTHGVLEVSATLSRAYSIVGDHALANRVLTDAVALLHAREVAAYRPWLLGTIVAVLQTLSATELAAGNIPGALTRARAAAKIAEESVATASGSNQRGAYRPAAMTTLDLAKIYIRMKRFDEAADALKRSAKFAAAAAAFPDLTIDIARRDGPRGVVSWRRARRIAARVPVRGHACRRDKAVEGGRPRELRADERLLRSSGGVGARRSAACVAARAHGKLSPPVQLGGVRSDGGAAVRRRPTWTI
jgi:tetratricopeptide (TPR) repeat protein